LSKFPVMLEFGFWFIISLLSLIVPHTGMLLIHFFYIFDCWLIIMPPKLGLKSLEML